MIRRFLVSLCIFVGVTLQLGLLLRNQVVLSNAKGSSVRRVGLLGEDAEGVDVAPQLHAAHMTETIDKLDKFLLGFSDDSDWRCVRKEEVYGAFVVTGESLLALEALMLNAVTRFGTGTTHSERVIVVFSGKGAQQYASVREVLELRNPRVGRITGISIQVRSSEGLTSMWLDDVGIYSFHSIVFLIAGNSESGFEEISASITAECANIRCWYSRLRRLTDRSGSIIRRVPSIVAHMILLVGALLIVLGAIYDQGRYQEWHAAAESAVSVYDTAVANGAHVDANTVAAVDRLNEMLKHHHHPIVGTSLRVIGGWVFGYSLIIIAMWTSPLFPRVIFEIGEGVKRSEEIAWLRRFLIGSVLICGILLPLIRYALVR